MGRRVVILVALLLIGIYPVARAVYLYECDRELNSIVAAATGLYAESDADGDMRGVLDRVGSHFGAGVLKVAVRRPDGPVLSGDAAVLAEHPQITSVIRRGERWEVAVAPIGGWDLYHRQRMPVFNLFYGMATAILLIICFTLGYWQRVLTGLISRRTQDWLTAKAEAARLHRDVAVRGAELSRANEQLRLSSIVFDHAGEAIMVTDGSNRILHVNRAFERMTGYSGAEVLGQSPKILASGRHGPEFYQELWHSVSTTGSWSGEIWNRRRNGDIYPEWLRITAVRDGDGPPDHYIAMFSDISDRKALEARMSHLAFHDPLTGLPNRLLMIERLRHAVTRAERSGRQVTLLMLDLDRFKVINDAFGHAVGDALLLAVSERLIRMMAPGDVLCRPGGDEFVMLLVDQTDLSHTLRLAAGLNQLGHSPVMVEGHDLTISTSVGISVYPRDGQDPETLIKNADAALYAAKDLGRNTFRFYTEDISSQAQYRQRIETELRHALERQEFELYFQPQVNCLTGRLIGAEALIRWHHPERGLVSPAEFIPVLEETGLILQAGKWVIETAALAAARLGGCPIAVNVSALQLRRGNIVEDIRGAIEQAGIAPDLLEVEITESTLMEDAPRYVQTLEELKRLGVRLSIDDFGTGYSSLSYLGRYNVDVIKIDQSFVRGLADTGTEVEIITAIISLAHALNLQVIAEGVETDDQHQRLRMLGCDLLQGYLFGRPMPEADLRHLLQRETESLREEAVEGTVNHNGVVSL